jgi:LPS-assembly protein
MRLSSILAALILVAGVSMEAAAQDPNQVLITADSLSHDQETGVVTATGGVEVTSGPFTLLAAQIIYDPNSDVVRAVGDVALLEPDGDVVFADELELSDGLRNGFISGIRVLLADRSRLVAVQAQRTDGITTEMTDAIFTACDTCGNGADPPVWQVRAEKIVHNQEDRRIDYINARLEFFGFPVAYTPFFTHPDPTVTHQTGFLAPTYGNSSHLGLKLEVPYHFALAEDRDFTFAPVFTTKEGVVLAGEYRQRTATGQYDIRASATRTDEREGLAKTGRQVSRGHVATDGQFRINDTVRWGFSGSRSTDDTYLRRYDLSDDNTLVSNIFMEAMRGRDYAAVNAWAFQGLQVDDDPGATPLILPMIDYQAISKPGAVGQTMNLGANFVSLTRNQGADSHRLSAEAGWRLPYTSPLGDVYTATASLRGDMLFVSGVTDPTDPTGKSLDGYVGRMLPQVALDWRFPLIRSGQTTTFLIEPVAAVIVGPSGGNPDKIPNEDSIAFEFDDTNLFSASRFPGYDRWEGGARVNYGLKFGAYSRDTVATAMIGQTFRRRDDSTFGARSGLDQSPSDYVGRINLDIGPYVQIGQRFRMDRSSFSLRRNEVDLAIGPENLQFSAGYVFLARELSTDELGQREELNFSGRAVLGQGWTATVRSRHDLSKDGGLLLAGFGLIYECDCAQFSVELVRRRTVDRDIPRSTSITVRIKLRHLG